MSYDLALSRIDHDMDFARVSTNPSKYSIFPIDGADKVAQQIKINLLSLLGEWFLDVDYGVPYLEEILVKNPRMSSVESILRNHINSIPNVIRIESFSMAWDRRTRILLVEFAAATDLGPIQQSVKLSMNRVMAAPGIM